MTSLLFLFFFSSRRLHTRWPRDWSSDVCSSDLQFCFELRTVTPAPANLLGIVLCHYKHPLIISWVLSLAYFDGAEKMPSPDAYDKKDKEQFEALRSEERRVGKEGRCGRVRKK